MLILWSYGYMDLKYMIQNNFSILLTNKQKQFNYIGSDIAKFWAHHDRNVQISLHALFRNTDCMLGLNLC